MNLFSASDEVALEGSARPLDPALRNEGSSSPGRTARRGKGLGQHFLVDGSYLKHILNAAELTANDNVIEVGPGLGVLTRALAEQAGHILAVEKDEHLAGSR